MDDWSPIRTERLARPWWAELSLFFAAAVFAKLFGLGKHTVNTRPKGSLSVKSALHFASELGDFFFFLAISPHVYKGLDLSSV